MTEKFDELRHYGVIGMHWGVRKTETKDSYRHGKKVRSAGDVVEKYNPDGTINPRYKSGANLKTTIVRIPGQKKKMTPEQKEKIKKVVIGTLATIGGLALTDVALKKSSGLGLVGTGELFALAAKIKLKGLD